jgi:hypothetical protein
MGFCLNYTLGVSIVGVFFLSILSIMSFVNVESLKIEKDKNKNSALALAITAGVSI